MKHKFRKEGGKMRRRIFSIAMALAMAVTAFALPQNASKVQAAGVNAPSTGTFWTSDQLKALGGSSPHYATGTTFQKANYGGKEWYAIGADEGCLVMLSTSQIAKSKFDASSTYYNASYIYSGLNGDSPDATQQAYNKNTLFSSEELGYIFSAVEGGKLYLPDGNSSDTSNFTVGSSNQYKIPIDQWVENNDSHGVGHFFWLRSAATDDIVLCVNPSNGSVGIDRPSSVDGSVVPAFNLNLSSVLFSSAADAAWGDVHQNVVPGAMFFRFNGSKIIKSNATYYGSKVTVTKDASDNDLYLCVQYKDEREDDIITKPVSSTGDVDFSRVGSDLSNAKIWLEKKDGSLLYAKMATAGSKPSPEPGPSPDPNPNPDPTPDSGEKYTDVAVSSGNVKDITNSTQIAKSENPYRVSIVNNTLLEQLLGISSSEKSQGVNVWLEMKNATVDKDSQDKIVAAAKGYTIGTYLDVNLFKKIGANDPEKVPNLNGKMKISFILPENLRKAGRSYRLIRLHDGNATAISGTLNTTDNTLTFETDGFSTYAIAYTDAAATPNAATTSPKTGETSNMLVWLIVMLLALGMTGIVVSRKRY